jgi:hypothetical protein
VRKSRFWPLEAILSRFPSFWHGGTGFAFSSVSVASRAPESVSQHVGRDDLGQGRIPATDYRNGIAPIGIPDTEYRNQNTGIGIPDIQFMYWKTGFRIHDAGFRGAGTRACACYRAYESCMCVVQGMAQTTMRADCGLDHKPS